MYQPQYQPPHQPQQQPQFQSPYPQQLNPYAAPLAAPVAQPSGLALTVVGLMAVVAAFPLLSRVLWAFIPRDASFDTLQAARYTSLGVESLLMLGAAILFLVLLHGVYKNLHARGAPLRYSPGFAVGSWFIPFANIVLPYLAVRDAFRFATGKGAGLVLGWWLVYMLSIPLRMAWQVMTSPGMGGVDFIPVLNAIGPLGTLVHIVAFGLWALVARGLGNASTR
jgi:hypothetical protein